MSINTPIVNAGTSYSNSLGLTRASATTLTVASGACRNSTNVNDITLPSSVTVNGTVVGVNGVDIAALVASSFYGVYLIGDSTAYKATAALLSLNATTPSLPFGYDMYRRIGWILTDGSANILNFYQYGASGGRTYFYDVAISALSGGTSTTYANVSLAASVPPISTEAIILHQYQPNASGNVAHLLPFGSSATNGIIRLSAGAANGSSPFTSVVRVPIGLNAGVPTIQYKVASSDSLTLLTAGYIDFM